MCSLYWHIGRENFGPNSVNIGAALFMVTILPAFAACAYTPQLVRARALGRSFFNLLLLVTMTVWHSYGSASPDLCATYAGAGEACVLQVRANVASAHGGSLTWKSSFMNLNHSTGLTLSQHRGIQLAQ